jgi:hypothetical protein
VTENEPERFSREEGRYGWTDWAHDGYRGPPPWRRGFQPVYFGIVLVLIVGLLTLFWVGASGRLP